MFDNDNVRFGVGCGGLDGGEVSEPRMSSSGMSARAKPTDESFREVAMSVCHSTACHDYEVSEAHVCGPYSDGSEMPEGFRECDDSDCSCREIEIVLRALWNQREPLGKDARGVVEAALAMDEPGQP